MNCRSQFKTTAGSCNIHRKIKQPDSAYAFEQEGARLTWPVFPFNPYKDGPETTLEHAVGVLSLPLKAEDQEIRFSIDVE